MKTVLAVMLLATSALAQGSSVRPMSACGIKDVTFEAKVDATRNTPALPDSGKAMIYFIQDDGQWGDHQHYVLKVALDGAWVGAYKENSYFSVPVKPGEHHVCAEVQSGYPVGNLISLAHFKAESGETYYLRTRFLSGINGFNGPPYVELDPLDSDEAKYLISFYPLSISSAKK
ncbi:MAG: DUF2846 domain-containing protein [Acidobacteriaceae bacterium]|jgi:hypothetical protein